MTPEQILDLKLEDLEKLTDEKLLEYFEPYLSKTRPQVELAKVTASAKKKKTIDLEKKMTEGQSLLKQIELLALAYGKKLD